MIDPGRPFSDAHSYQALIQSLEEQLRQGVEQPAQKTFVVNANATYEFPQQVDAIQEVRENKLTNPRNFLQDQDYRLLNNRLTWLQTPPDGTRLIVRYTYRESPAGLNDFNPGSVVGTLVRAFSRELKLLYGQMDEAYRRAFIDTATGVALDNVVRLLNVERKHAEKAKGVVTFTRKDTTESVTIPQNTRLADESSQEFVTLRDTVFAAGLTTLDVAVEAVKAGPAGNVSAGSIVIMPTPLPELGKVEVTNPESLRGGQDPESDEQLRERAKFEIERSGNATLNAIKYAVLELEGIDEVEVLDQSIDATIPLGEIRVRYSSDTDSPELQKRVEDVVNNTRAAGVLAQVKGIERLLVSGTFYLIPEPTQVEGATNQFKQQAQQFIDGLSIGEPLSLRRLNALVYNVAGLADVAEAQLSHNRSGDVGNITDPFLTTPSELLRTETIEIRLVKGLNVTRTQRTNNRNQLSLQLVDSADNPIEFRDFSIDISLVLMATLKRAPDQPPERILTLTRSLNISEQHTVSFFLADSDLLFQPETGRGFRPADHQPQVSVTIRAAAYPGIAAAIATISLPAESA